MICGDNIIGDEGCGVIGEALKHNSTLTQLHLRSEKSGSFRVFRIDSTNRLIFGKVTILEMVDVE